MDPVEMNAGTASAAGEGAAPMGASGVAEDTDAAPTSPALADDTAAAPTSPALADNTAAARVSSASLAEIEERVVETLKTVYDPEIPVNIYELGLIYKIDVQEGGVVDVVMTLTAPGCPVAFTMPGEIEDRLRTIPGVSEAHVQVTWEPPWNKDMMSEAAKLQLGFW